MGCGNQRGWTRTTTTRSKVWRPAIRRPGNANLVYPIAALRMQALSDALDAVFHTSRISRVWES